MSGNKEPDLSQFGIQSHWLRDVPSRRVLLVVYAHPDDESFGNAGTIARYTAQGVAVHYVCATRGESGTVDPEFLREHSDVGSLRSSELACAAETLGLASVHYLNYRDSGMQGSPDNEHARAFIQAPVERVAGQVTAVIRALRPQVVLTFPPYGGYGHPDHIHVHKSTLAAFAAAGEPEQYPEHLAHDLEPHAPLKLYYSTLGTGMFKVLLPVLRVMRRDPRRFGRNADVDLVRVAEEATPVTTVVDCRAYLAQKEEAWRCHASQGAGMGFARWLPGPARRRMLGSETFTRAIPSWHQGRRKERDLFASVKARQHSQ